MKIHHNLSALTAYNALASTHGALQKVTKRLSTGLRINEAADDAAGLAISERMRAQVKGMEQAITNAENGVSLIQTAEGALSSVHSILQRMRELSVQAASDALTSQDRASIQLEMDELKAQVDGIAKNTQFNNKRLLDGSAGAVWSSSDLTTAAVIRGPLAGEDRFGQRVTAEGNYRIEITADPGEAQVQKTHVLKIKHEDVTMNEVLDKRAGAERVAVKDVPAGAYALETVKQGEASLEVTGAYGISAGLLPRALAASVRTAALEKNASILFEVEAVNEGAVTLRATASTLATDGATQTQSQTFTLTEGGWTDLTGVFDLGKAGTDPESADGAFEMRLQTGQASLLSAGDKFVYNLTAAQGVAGADRTVRVTGVQEEEWPDRWEAWDTLQVSKVLSFPVPDNYSSAQVLFLIDDSSTMQTSIDTVRENVNSFVSAIKAQGVDDVQIAIASYHGTGSGLRFTRETNWTNSNASVAAALNSINLTSAQEDHYWGIAQAVSGFTWNDGGQNSYMVLVTDANAESSGSNGVSAADALDALTGTGITFSAVRRSTAASVFNGFVTGTGGLAFDQGSSTWGTALSSDLGGMIGRQSAGIPSSTTTLADLNEIGDILADAGGSVTLTLAQGEASTTVTVDEADTIADFVAKLNAAVSAGLGQPTQTAVYVDDTTNGRAGTIVIESAIPGKEGVITFSGNAALVSALGFTSTEELGTAYATERPLAFSLDSGAAANRDIHFRNFYLNSENGTVYEGDIVLTTNGTVLPEEGRIGTFDAAYVGEVAKGGARLRDLDAFWNSSGVCLLDDPQTLTITQGDGASADVTLYATDTVEDMRRKINDAIAYGLGQARTIDGDAGHLATFVEAGGEDAQGPETVAGTLVIRSAIAGKAGELTFSASEDLLNALGLNTIQASSESAYTVSVADAHTGEAVATGVRVTGSLLSGVIHPNVDVTFDAMAGVTASWNEAAKGYTLTSKRYVTFLHLADNSLTLQTGANQGEDYIVDIGDMSAAALGLDGLDARSRENAGRAITVLDGAIRRVSAARARLGASQNALETAAENLSTASANLTAAESKIRDADMAALMMEFVKLQILSQSGLSMLSQANQLPQGVLSLLR